MKLLITILALVSMNFALADVEKHGGGFSTKEFCAENSKTTCAHAHFHEYPNTTEESEFVVHVEPTDDSQIITDINVTLWMDMGEGHGHGSAPVEISPSDEENHFNVQNAWFPMMGEWQIIVSFIDNGVLQTIKIPVQIKE